MRTSWVLITGMAMLLIAASLHAQQEEDRGQRQRRGGPGQGFRGGSFGPGGGATALLGLLREDAVRKELELVEDQEQKLREMAEKIQGDRERPDVNFRELSQEEREEFFRAMQARADRVEEEVEQTLAQILLPHQLERLKQIQVQVQGGRALLDPDVAEQLKLTEQQKEQLETIQVEARQKMREIFQGGNREGAREQVQKAMQESDQQMLAVLTDQQKQQFEQMKGEAFEMPERALGFGGRGPQGRRGGERQQQ